jgi:DNA-binding GntR family transcriptional regulator
MNALIEATRRWQFDRRLPLAQQVYADLRRRIISLDLPPDSPLSRVELSQYYQISQTPLREALQKLGEEGLVATYPQSRTEVSRIDVDQILEAQFLRKAVEADIVARLAADPDKAKLAPAQDTHDRLVRSWESEHSFEDFAELDRQFHRDLYVGAGMASLTDLVETRCGQLDRIRRLHLQWFNDRKPEKVVSDHRSILDAILQSDVEGAQRAMREHLGDTVGRIDVLRANYPDYFG